MGEFASIQRNDRVASKYKQKPSLSSNSVESDESAIKRPVSAQLATTSSSNLEDETLTLNCDTAIPPAVMSPTLFSKFFLLAVAFSVICLLSPVQSSVIPGSDEFEETSESVEVSTPPTTPPTSTTEAPEPTQTPSSSATTGPCLVPESEVEYLNAQLNVAVSILKSSAGVAPSINITTNEVQAEEPEREVSTSDLRMCSAQRLEKVTVEMTALANEFWRLTGSSVAAAEVESLKSKKTQLIQRFSELHYEEDSGTSTFRLLVGQLEQGLESALSKLVQPSGCASEAAASTGLETSTEVSAPADPELVESFAAAVQIKEVHRLCAQYSRFVLAFNFSEEATFHAEPLGRISYGKTKSYPAVLMTVPEFWNAEHAYMRIANSYLAEEIVKCAKNSKLLVIVDNTDDDSDDLADKLAKAILKLMEVVPGIAKYGQSLALLVTGANNIRQDSAGLSTAVADSVVQSRIQVQRRLPQVLARDNDIYAVYDAILKTDARGEYVNIAVVEDEGDVAVFTKPEVLQFIKSTSTKSKYHFRKIDSKDFKVALPANAADFTEDIEGQLQKEVISTLQVMNSQAVAGLETVCFDMPEAKAAYLLLVLQKTTGGKVDFNPYILESYRVLRQLYGNFTNDDVITKIESYHDYLTYVTSSPGTSRVQPELTSKAVDLLNALVQKVKSNAATSLRNSVKEVLTAITDVIKSYESDASSVTDVNAAYRLIKETKDVMSTALDLESTASTSSSAESKITQVLSFWNVSESIQTNLACATQRHQFLIDLPSTSETDGIITSTMVGDVQSFTATVYNVQARVLKNLLSLAATKLQEGADVETIVEQLDRETLLMALSKLNTFSSTTLFKNLVPHLPGNGVPDVMVHQRFFEITANATGISDLEILEFDAALQRSYEKAGREARGQLTTLMDAIRPSRDAVLAQAATNISEYLEAGLEPPSLSTFQYHGAEIIRQIYDGNVTNLDVLLNYTDSLQEPFQDRVLAYETLLGEMIRLEQLDSVEFVTLAAHLKETQDLFSIGSSVPKETAEALEKLVEKIPQSVRHLVSSSGSGNSTCVLKNMIYNGDMYTASVYVYVDGRATYQRSNKYYWRFETSNGGKTFKIRNGNSYLLGDSYYSRQYHTGQYSSRGVLSKDAVDPNSRSSAAEWKVIPTDGGKYVRFANVKYPEDVLYAEGSTKSANQAMGWRILASKLEPFSLIRVESVWNVVCSDQ